MSHFEYYVIRRGRGFFKMSLSANTEGLQECVQCCLLLCPGFNQAGGGVRETATDVGYAGVRDRRAVSAAVMTARRAVANLSRSLMKRAQEAGERAREAGPRCRAARSPISAKTMSDRWRAGSRKRDEVKPRRQRSSRRDAEDQKAATSPEETRQDASGSRGGATRSSGGI